MSVPTTPNFFEQGSPFLNHPLLTQERTSREVDFIIDVCNLGDEARILDVGCGFGRHCIELTRRGYDVTGIDVSAAMIEEARRQASTSGVSVDFRRQDGESFSASGLYEAAICLFTTLGQITNAADNLGLLDQVYTALKPNSAFVVEVPQRSAYVSRLKSKEQIGKGNRLAYVTRHYDEETQVISENFRLVKEDSEQLYLLKYRIFDQTELRTRLTNAGFRVIAAYGDFQGHELGMDDTMMVMVAAKNG